jgi:hypothetical protein
MVQHLAQTLRWWEGEVTPFIVRPLGGDMWAKKKMAENGMPMHSILEELRRKFDWYVAISQVEVCSLTAFF